MHDRTSRNDIASGHGCDRRRARKRSGRPIDTIRAYWTTSVRVSDTVGRTKACKISKRAFCGGRVGSAKVRAGSVQNTNREFQREMHSRGRRHRPIPPSADRLRRVTNYVVDTRYRFTKSDSTISRNGRDDKSSDYRGNRPSRAIRNGVKNTTTGDRQADTPYSGRSDVRRFKISRVDSGGRSD